MQYNLGALEMGAGQPGSRSMCKEQIFFFI